MGKVLQQRNDPEGTAPSIKDGKVGHHSVPPKRRYNADVRSREYLTPDEAEALIAAAGRVGRHSHRDSTLLFLAYRHGLRVSELVALRWDQVDLTAALLHVQRLKNGTPSTPAARTGTASTEAATSGAQTRCGVRVHDGARQPDHYIYRSEDGPARR